MEYNSVKDEVYVSLKVKNEEKEIRTYSLVFQCSTGGSTITDQTVYLESCPCPAGMLFDKLIGQCAQSHCPPGGCDCPPGRRWNSYGLSCQLDCAAVPHSSLSAAFGRPPQCYCSLPHAWNPAASDCSFFDCPRLPLAAGAAGRTCACVQGADWDAEGQLCRPGLRPAPTPPQIDVPAPNSPPVGAIVAVLLFLILFAAGVWFYFKKCRKTAPPNAGEGGTEAEGGEPKESERGLAAREAGPRQLICDLESNEQLGARA